MGLVFLGCPESTGSALPGLLVVYGGSRGGATVLRRY